MNRDLLRPESDKRYEAGNKGDVLGVVQNMTSASVIKSSKPFSFSSKTSILIWDPTFDCVSESTRSFALALDRFTIVIFRMSSPLRRIARRMCHSACFPAPNTMMFSVFFRYRYNNILPSDVLNAVNSAAFNTPTA